MKIFLTLLSCTLFYFTIELEKRSLLNNRIEILVPKDFKEMSKELINLKYPGANRPKLILTDEGGTTNLAFSILENQVDSSSIKEYEEAIKTSYKKTFPNATWIKDGIISINKKSVGFLKLITEAKDQKIYNYLFLTDIDGKLLVGTFNCVEKDMPIWVKISDEMINSLTVR